MVVGRSPFVVYNRDVDSTGNFICKCTEEFESIWQLECGV